MEYKPLPLEKEFSQKELTKFAKEWDLTLLQVKYCVNIAKILSLYVKDTGDGHSSYYLYFYPFQNIAFSGSDVSDYEKNIAEMLSLPENFLSCIKDMQTGV